MNFRGARAASFSIIIFTGLFITYSFIQQHDEFLFDVCLSCASHEIGYFSTKSLGKCIKLFHYLDGIIAFLPDWKECFAFVLKTFYYHIIFIYQKVYKIQIILFIYFIHFAYHYLRDLFKSSPYFQIQYFILWRLIDTLILSFTIDLLLQCFLLQPCP